MADARRPKKADYQIHGAMSKDVDSKMAKNKRAAAVENVKAHQIPETATVDDLVKALSERNATGFIKVTELCSAIISEFGGLGGYAKLIKEVFDSTESGHLKARMLESQIKLITSVNKMMGEEDPVDTMSDDDISREAKVMFGKFYGVAPNGAPGANDGLGVAAVPQADGGVGQAPVGSVEHLPPTHERGAVSFVQEEDTPDR